MIKKFKPFNLGFCNCGCNAEIDIKPSRGYLLRFKSGHKGISKKIRICIVCGQQTKVFRKLRCGKCYRLFQYGIGQKRIDKTTISKICTQCSITKINLRLIKGLCINCYNKEKVRQAQDKSKRKECECGCGELIPSLGKHYRENRFVKGHSTRGINHPMFGKKHKKESIIKM